MAGGICECGCGETTPLCRYTLRNYGYIKGEPLRFVPGHQNFGRHWSPDAIAHRAEALKGHAVSLETKRKISENHKAKGIRPSPEATAKSNENRPRLEASPTWKGGRSMTNGYPSVYLPDHPRAHPNGYAYEHIVLAEQSIGRSLVPPEIVHHVDGDKTNNAVENLMVMPSQAEHIRLHKQQGDML